VRATIPAVQVRGERSCGADRRRRRRRRKVYSRGRKRRRAGFIRIDGSCRVTEGARS